MQRIKKGDEVIVITGKDKGRRGSVLRIDSNGGVAGGIVDRELALEPSKVMLFNPTTQKGDRVGFRQLADGRKVRFFKSNGEVVDT
jgi:large subunit ribosomal protein L24